MVLNVSTGKPVARVKTGRRPYRILFLPDGKTYLVSNWADGTVSQFQASDNAPMTTLRLGPHPTDMILRAGANENEEGGRNGWGGCSSRRRIRTAYIASVLESLRI